MSWKAGLAAGVGSGTIELRSGRQDRPEAWQVQ